MKFTITYLPPPYSLRFSVFAQRRARNATDDEAQGTLGRRKRRAKPVFLCAQRGVWVRSSWAIGRFPFSQNFRNFRLAVNGTRFIGSSHWKIPRKKWKIWKGGLLFQVGISERNFVFHSHVSRSLYQFQVHGKKICHGQLANQNGFPRAHVSMRFVFLLAPQWKHFCTTSALTLD